MISDLAFNSLAAAVQPATFSLKFIMILLFAFLFSLN